MKKLIYTCLCCALLISTGAAAATRQYSRTLSQFSAIDISGPFSVSLVRGGDYRALLTVEEEYIDYVICNVKGSVLSLGLDERKVPSEVKKIFRGKGTPDPVFEAVVYVPELLQGLTMSGKAVLSDTEDLFDKSRTTFSLSGNCGVMPISVSTLTFSMTMQNKASADIAVTSKESFVEAGNTSVLKYEEECDNS